MVAASPLPSATGPSRGTEPLTLLSATAPLF